MDFAIGFNLTVFILGILLSPIGWAITGLYRKEPWKWYNWLNSGAYIMICLKVLSIFVREYLEAYHG